MIPVYSKAQYCSQINRILEEYDFVGVPTENPREFKYYLKRKEEKMENQEKRKINLTPQNLQRYGDIVLSREWTSPTGAFITERYIVWNTDKMNGVPEDQCRENKKKMYLLTMANGETITMKIV